MQAKIRKHQTTLICSGYAVIAFGLWSIIRDMLMFTFNNSYMQRLMEANRAPSQEEIPIEFLVIVGYALVGIILAGDLGIRLYTGLAAVSRGKGRHRRVTYAAVSAVYLIFNVSVDFYAVFSSIGSGTFYDVLPGAVVNLSFLIAFEEIVRAEIMLRRCERKQAGGTDNAA